MSMRHNLISPQQPSRINNFFSAAPFIVLLRTVEPDACLSIEAQIKQQVHAMTAPKGSATFSSVHSDLRGVVIVCAMDPSVDVLALVTGMYADIKQSRSRRCRHLVRVVPLVATCHGDAATLQEAAAAVIKPAFSNAGSTSIKWAANVTRRSTGLARDKIIDIVAAFVPGVHTVSLTQPDTIVLVEALKGLIGVTVVQADIFHACADFNMRRAQDANCE